MRIQIRERGRFIRLAREKCSWNGRIRRLVTRSIVSTNSTKLQSAREAERKNEIGHRCSIHLTYDQNMGKARKIPTKRMEDELTYGSYRSDGSWRRNPRETPSFQIFQNNRFRRGHRRFNPVIVELLPLDGSRRTVKCDEKVETNKIHLGKKDMSFASTPRRRNALKVFEKLQGHEGDGRKKFTFSSPEEVFQRLERRTDHLTS